MIKDFCPHCNAPSPQKIFEAAKAGPDGYKVFSLFGRTAQQILQALNFWDLWHTKITVPTDAELMQGLTNYKYAEKSKMTRSECEQKVSEIGGYNLDAAKWVRIFEALGLLKFEEKKDDPFLVSFPIKLAKFTKITMEDGSYVQGLLKSIWQGQRDTITSSPRPVPQEYRIRDTQMACLDFMKATASYQTAMGDLSQEIKQLKNCLDEW